MKKIISAVIAVVMIAAMITTSALAADADNYVSPGNIIVPYIAESNITIDGTLEQGEWSETNKILLNETNLVPWVGAYEGPIEFFYSWTDNGLLVAAKVSDPYVTFNTVGSGANNSRFQLAFDPAGIITEDYNGLFFSFCLDDPEESSNVNAYKHNWESSADACTYIDPDEEEHYKGKYSLNKDEEGNLLGFNMEVLLPWTLIATPDRDIDLDLDRDDAIPLTSFNPKDENRARAFITTKICYVGFDAAGALYAAGTFTDADTSDWNTSSYDVVLFLALEGETERETVTEYFTLEGEGQETEPPEETKAPETKAPETKAPDTEPKQEDTKAPDTKAPEKDTKPVDKPSTGDNNKFPWWIIIVAVVVIAAVVVGIILAGKKKKA